MLEKDGTFQIAEKKNKRFNRTEKRSRGEDMECLVNLYNKL